MTTTAKFIFTLGTSLILLLAAYLLFGLLPKLTAAPPLSGAYEIVYVDRGMGELVAKEIHAERGHIAADLAQKRALIATEKSALTNVAGATARQVIPNPHGTFIATIEENTLSVKWKYSPFGHQIAAGVPYANLQWLDDYYFLVEGGGQVTLFDISGQNHLSLPGQNYELLK